MNICSWLSLGLVVVIFISSQTVGVQAIGSRTTNKYRRSTNTTACKDIKFMKKTDACSIEIGTSKYPILGSCTTYYQCDFTGSLLLEEKDTTCTTGQVFDVITKECQPGNTTAVCKQIKCLKHLKHANETSLTNSTEIIDSVENETEKPNISTIPDENSEKETEIIGSTHNNDTHGHQKESEKNHDVSSGEHSHIGFGVLFVGCISSVLNRFHILST